MINLLGPGTKVPLIMLSLKKETLDVARLPNALLFTELQPKIRSVNADCSFIVVDKQLLSISRPVKYFYAPMPSMKDFLQEMQYVDYVVVLSLCCVATGMYVALILMLHATHFQK